MSLEYMRPGLEDHFGFLKLQDKILGIMVYIDQFCADHGIEYCLMGGSALGSKRHGGFIPWDDDLDIFMTPSNYEKFRDEFNVAGDKSKYYLQEWGLTEGMVTIAKVRLNGTTYMEDAVKDWDIHHGIYVDIFILHSCPNNKFSQIYQCFWGKYVIIKGLALRERNRHTGLKGALIKTAKVLPDKFLIEYGLRQVYKYRNRDTKYYCNFLGKAVFKKGIYKREWFDHPVYAPFETIQLKVPGNLHEFLSERFGDYMKLPSLDQIKWEQHAERWDTDHEYVVQGHCGMVFKDEDRLI